MTQIIVRTRPAVKSIVEDLFLDSPDRRESFTQADLEWAADHLNADCTDYDVVEEPELEWPGTRDEFERWLDAIAPTDGELEHRARVDAFLGHDA
jgi:hypothetical protein